ncbi:unnamed protein product [Spirodela intermedia]|uniref:Sphingomyelin synthase-like domain-containing protein n=1 Tax=Spirodela intermedia TaxID=51605 RepID=A0A7I8IKG1_SPIIN|nr:unnamed protein product [Spirodela intermedia]CAA6658351.1 unnamed protein product [Spirodela intermedia]
MTLYVAREASKLWRKITMELSVELQLLSEKWKFILAGLIFQYLHGLAARGVHYLHRPGPILKMLDSPFYQYAQLLLSELGKDRGYISESLFSFWTFHPFIFHSKRFYTASQILRIITFYSTQLPGPNYHCREGSKLAVLPRPDSILEVLLINCHPRGVIYGCGDLIFSSHMIFTLVFVLTYQKYGTKRILKFLAWLVAIAQSLLIVASRKHYTVDVVVAWYTVNLVVFFIDRKLQGMPPSSLLIFAYLAGPVMALLPVSVKDKDSKPKEEHQRLLNGNSAETNNDWRQRSQANGKILEDGTHARAEPAMNGK